MLKFLNKIGLTVAAFVGIALASAVGQIFAPNLPIIGGASYCSSTVNAACVNTVAAGPALSGSEFIPVDTGIASGQQPTSAKVNLQTLGSGTYQYVVPVTADTVTATALNNQVIVNPAGTIAALTFVTPAASALLDGQVLGFCTTQIITTLTVTAGSGTTVANAPTAMLVPVATGAASCVRWRYRQANTTWYRTQ